MTVYTPTRGQSECGGGAGSCDACALGDLSDVDTTGGAEGDVLTLEAGEWVPAPSAAAGLARDVQVVSGDVSTLTTTWATLTGYEVTIAAAAGDIIALALSTYANAFVSSGQVALDIGTVVSGAVVNRISGGTGNSDHGCLEAFTVNTVKGTGISRTYEVQPGDIEAGTVTFRGLYRNPTGSCTLTASANFRSHIEATNLGPSA